jgi:tRNA1Val (adenine37-N6)-methyltransferase
MTERLYTLDTIYHPAIVIAQRRGGYRFSVDALLLAWFVRRHCGRRRIARSLELGAGSGVISILLKRQGLAGTIDCIERQEGLFSLLCVNIERNSLSEELLPRAGDLRSMPIERECYDIALFNPPYHPATTGRTSPDNERAAARHELFGTLDDFLRIGAAALKKRGHLFFIYPAARSAFAYASLAQNGLTPIETIAVREHALDDPSLFLIGCVRGAVSPGAQRFSLITMKQSDGTDTAVGAEILYADPERRNRSQ